MSSIANPTLFMDDILEKIRQLEKNSPIEELKILSDAGSEYERQYLVPPHLKKYQVPHAFPVHIYGPWGDMLFQGIPGTLADFWINRYFIKYNLRVLGRGNKPLSELYTALQNCFESTLNNKRLPVERAGYGAITYERHVDNVAVFSKGVYHNADFHLNLDALQEFAGHHPGFCTLLNHAAQKKSFTMPPLLQIDTDLLVLINQLKEPSCAPGMSGRFCDGKIDEFLMSALWKIDRKDEHKQFKVPRSLIEKAEEIELYMREHLDEFMNYSILSKLAGTNMNYLKIAFKERWGDTMDVYLRRLRMNAALKLMREFPGESMPDIALKVGYVSMKAFSRNFREEFGYLPRTLRP